MKLDTYYLNDLKYKGGFYEIKEVLSTHFSMRNFTDAPNNNGIVTIQFVVNCIGETGRFKVVVCDFEYQNSQINPEIVNQLLEAILKLKDWIPAKDENGLVVNSHKFFSFKIQNGKIVDIYPK